MRLSIPLPSSPHKHIIFNRQTSISLTTTTACILNNNDKVKEVKFDSPTHCFLSGDRKGHLLIFFLSTQMTFRAICFSTTRRKKLTYSQNLCLNMRFISPFCIDAFQSVPSLPIRSFALRTYEIEKNQSFSSLSLRR